MNNKVYGYGPSTTTTELMDMSKKLNINLDGIYFKTQLENKAVSLKNKINNKYKNFIINLDDHTGNGTHWVCMIFNKNNCFYFDSMGFDYPDEVNDFCSILNIKSIYTNILNIQPIEMSFCGQFVIFFLSQMKKPSIKNYNKFVKYFS